MTERIYKAVPALRTEEPLLIGIIGPPGGGKSLSSLRLAKGIQSVRGGPIRLLDTEGGRARKYHDIVPFEIVELPNARSHDFLDAIHAQLQDNPACIIVDSMSDEHENYLEWHDEMVPRMGNNEWAAWAKPKASRKKLISGILKIKTPLIFTFRAREKTKQDGKKVVNVGWSPVAPLEIVHTLDLTCILPPRANGVPIWHSEKIGEDFVIKLPNYLAPFIKEGKPLSEEMGAAFARWARGDAPEPQQRQADHGADGPAPSREVPPTEAESGAGPYVPEVTWDEYVSAWEPRLQEDGVTGRSLVELWNSAIHKEMRRQASPTKEQVDALLDRVVRRRDQLNRPKQGA